jgi:hypothetical protein
MDSATFRWDDEQPMLVVPDGAAARPVLAAAMREQFRAALGDTVDELCDAEMVDSIYYTLYPNLHPWGGYQTLITYRFRPHQDDHQRSVMECMLLASPFSRPALARRRRKLACCTRTRAAGERLPTGHDQFGEHAPRSAHQPKG